MTAFLNLALLIIGTAATLAAFGGKTWAEGDAPIWDRITPRGFISLLCLILALALGTTKEIYSRGEDRRKASIAAAEKAEDQAKAVFRQSVLAEQLAKANAKADIASQKLEDLKAIDRLTQDRLNDTKFSLSEVRENLGTTKQELGQQSVANLVTALAEGNKKIRDLVLIIPLTSKANVAKNIRDSLLPVFAKDECRDLAGIEIQIPTSNDKTERIYYSPGDKEDEHKYFDEENPKTDGIVNFAIISEQETLNSLLKMSHQDSTNKNVVFAALHPEKNPISAARYYAHVMTPGSGALYIVATWPTLFRTREELETASKKYPELLKIPKDLKATSDIAVDIASSHPYPEVCSNRVRDYLKTALRGAVLEAVVDQEQNETMFFGISALAPQKFEGGWIIPFTAKFIPLVTAADASDVETVFEDLPSYKASHPRN